MPDENKNYVPLQTAHIIVADKIAKDKELCAIVFMKQIIDELDPCARKRVLNYITDYSRALCLYV
jgi:hypothetical protein